MNIIPDLPNFIINRKLNTDKPKIVRKTDVHIDTNLSSEITTTARHKQNSTTVSERKSDTRTAADTGDTVTINSAAAMIDEKKIDYSDKTAVGHVNIQHEDMTLYNANNAAGKGTDKDKIEQQNFYITIPVLAIGLAALGGGLMLAPKGLVLSAAGLAAIGYGIFRLLYVK